MEVDKKEITIGDPIVYTLTIEADKDTHVELPPMLRGYNFSPFDLLGHRGVERDEVDGKRFYKSGFVLTAYVVGELDIPSLKIYYKDASGKEGEIETDVVRIEVKGVAPKEASEIRPLKAPLSPGKVVERPIWAIVGMVAGVSILLVVLFVVVMRLRRKEVVQAPAISPRDDALQELEGLEGVLKREGFKVYYNELVWVIRRFISVRFHIPVEGKTCGELIEALSTIQGIDGFGDVKGLLYDCDLVRFARYIPSDREIGEVMERARGVVSNLAT
ncbi:MAG: hypothetical protein HY878_02800 [Deltaproteobacteria bacterium]|nr:hypothetical protein [Deltaproteobacteria bacterium]